MFCLNSTIVTDRLLLSPVRAGDADHLYAIHSRPGVVRYSHREVRTRQTVVESLTKRSALKNFHDDDDVLTLDVERRRSRTGE